MAYAHVETVAITTDASGDSTDYTAVVTGPIISIHYTKTDFDAGVDFTITTEGTAQNLWVDTNVDATETVAPRQPTHNSTGAALVYDTDNKPVSDHIYAAQERIKIVTAQGGDTKTGTFKIIIGG